MDQTKPENKIIYRHHGKCRDDTGNGSTMQLPAIGLLEVQVKGCIQYAKNHSLVTDQLV
jgi:hypothetical protein